MIGFLARRFIQNYQNTADAAVRRAYGVLCGAVGIAINLLLFALKLLAVAKEENGEIQARVKEQTGLNVTPLYIAQVKRKHGIIERECYNKAKSESAKMLICPTDKEKAIEDALRFFGMIA